VHGTEFVFRSQQITLFLTTLAIAIAGTASLIFYLITAFFWGNPNPRQLMRRCLRRGFWLALAIVILGLLRLTQTFNPITALLTIASATAIEITLSSN